MISFERHVEGIEKLRTDLTISEATVPRRIQAQLDELGVFAHLNMLMYATGRERLLQSLDRDGVHLDPVTGEYVDQMGARGPNPWPLYHHGGTGLFGERRDYIYPREDRAPATVIATQRARIQSPGRGATMKFFSRGRWWYQKRTRGQEANPFVEEPYEKTNLYARGHMRDFARNVIS